MGQPAGGGSPFTAVASLTGSVDVDVAVAGDGTAYLTAMNGYRVLHAGGLTDQEPISPGAVLFDREWVVAGAGDTARATWA